MIEQQLNVEDFMHIPQVIWMSGNVVSIYCGKPIDMVRQMADEMGSPSVHETVGTLLTALGRNRGVLIAIPEEAPEEVLSAFFVYALINTGIGRPMDAQS